jgi:two-component system, chemotaxis family, sensor kinase CheA
VALHTDKFRSRFIEEARKHIAEFSQGVLKLEQTPTDTELTHHVFRTMHTLKGSSNMMGFEELSASAHEIENALDLIRNKTVTLGKSHVNLLLTCSDTLIRQVDCLELQKALEPMQDSLREQLQHFAILEEDGDVPSPQQNPLEKEVLEPPKTGNTSPMPRPESIPPYNLHSVAQETFTVRKEKLDSLINLVSELSLLNRTLTRNSTEITNYTSRLHQDLIKRESFQLKNSDKSILQLASDIKGVSGNLLKDLHTLELLNEEIKESLYSLRMVPLSMIFEKYPRIVRETSQLFHKDVVLRISGQETEMDKNIIDMIDESLIQIVRNAIDHGIESIEKRLSVGKSQRGTISIEASYDRGMAKIIISDDGCGIPVARLVSKAVEKGLMSDEDGERIKRYRNPVAVANLIISPGLSGAEIITNLSGRGVGMDIVHQNIINRLHGSLTVSTEEGKGTTFTILLPLNTAIMQVTIFSIRGAHVAVPSHTVQEVVMIDSEQFIEVAKKQALRLREQIIPIMHIEELFVPESSMYENYNQKSVREAREGKKEVALIVQTSSGLVALIAQDIISQESAVIHALPPHLGSTPWVSGCLVNESNRIIHLVNTQVLMDHIRNSRGRSEVVAEIKKDIHILVADDSMSTREIEKSILESYGYIVDIASDGQEAKEMAMDTPYDVVVTDIEMPRLDGFGLTTYLRTQKSYRHTPIILVTSRDSKEDKARGAQVGADAYIVKSSFDQEQLIQTIKSLTH